MSKYVLTGSFFLKVWTILSKRSSVAREAFRRGESSIPRLVSKCEVQYSNRDYIIIGVHYATVEKCQSYLQSHAQSLMLIAQAASSLPPRISILLGGLRQPVNKNHGANLPSFGRIVCTRVAIERDLVTVP